MLGFLRALRSCSSSFEGIFDTVELGVAGNQTSAWPREAYSTGGHEH